MNCISVKYPTPFILDPRLTQLEFPYEAVKISFKRLVEALKESENITSLIVRPKIGPGEKFNLKIATFWSNTYWRLRL